MSPGRGGWRVPVSRCRSRPLIEYARQTPARPRLPPAPYFCPPQAPFRAGRGHWPPFRGVPGGGLGLARWPMLRQVRSGQVTGRPIKGPRGALDPAGHLGQFAKAQSRVPKPRPAVFARLSFLPAKPHPPETPGGHVMAGACAALGPLSGAGAADILVSIPPQVLTWEIGLCDDHPN